MLRLFLLSYLWNGATKIVGQSLKSADSYEVFGFQTTTFFLVVSMPSGPCLYRSDFLSLENTTKRASGWEFLFSANEYSSESLA